MFVENVVAKGAHPEESLAIICGKNGVWIFT
jgi:hypothetical protein